MRDDCERLWEEVTWFIFKACHFWRLKIHEIANQNTWLNDWNCKQELCKSGHVSKQIFYFGFYDAFSNSGYIASGIWMTDEWRAGKDFGRMRLWPNRSTILVIALRDWRKSPMLSVRMAEAPVEIRNKHPPNTSLKRYRWASLLDVVKKSAGLPYQNVTHPMFLQFSVVQSPLGPLRSVFRGWTVASVRPPNRII
jgi:hypothetical protein